MLATLYSYEAWLGPYHPQTLSLMTRLAIAYGQAGEVEYARPLLEKVVRDLGQNLGRDHDLRLHAMDALRELWLAQGNYERAATIQQEILGCRMDRMGADHPDTLTARANLAMILLETVDSDSAKEA